MEHYALRLKDIEGYEGKFDQVFTDRFDQVLGVFHTGKEKDNPHYHFLLRCDYKSQRLRQYLKSHFDQGKGNRHLSLKPWDQSSKAISYMFHEDNRDTFKVVINRGFDETLILKAKQDNELIQSHIQGNTPHAISEGLAKGLKEAHPNRSWISSQGNHKIIFREIIMHYRFNGNNFFPNKWQIERLIKKIQSLLNPNAKDFEQLIEDWYSEMFI